MRGTLVNTGAVAAGAILGAIAGAHSPDAYKHIALQGLGLVTLGLGIKMFLETKNAVIVAGSVTAGGIIGLALNLETRVNDVAQQAQGVFHSGGDFAVGLVTSFVLFCVGPMTLIGCLEDGIEGKSELLYVKSTLDGISAFFLAATTGLGVLLTALLLLIFQGSITLLARPLKRLMKDDAMIGEAAATGGAILIASGLGLLEIKALPTVDYVPAIFIAPLLVAAANKLKRRQLA